MEAKKSHHSLDLQSARLRTPLSPEFRSRKGYEETYLRDRKLQKTELKKMSSGCRVLIELTQVKYYGKNLGQNWKYKLAIDGEPIYQYMGCHLRGEIRYPHRVVYDKYFENDCGTPLRLLLSGFAMEGDEIEDIQGGQVSVFE